MDSPSIELPLSSLETYGLTICPTPATRIANVQLHGGSKVKAAITRTMHVVNKAYQPVTRRPGLLASSMIGVASTTFVISVSQCVTLAGHYLNTH